MCHNVILILSLAIGVLSLSSAIFIYMRFWSEREQLNLNERQLWIQGKEDDYEKHEWWKNIHRFESDSRIPLSLLKWLIMIGFFSLMFFLALFVYFNLSCRYSQNNTIKETFSDIHRVLEERLPDITMQTKAVAAIESLSSRIVSSYPELDSIEKHLANINETLKERLPNKSKQSEFINALKGTWTLKSTARLPLSGLTLIIIGFVCLLVGFALFFCFDNQNKRLIGYLLSIGTVLSLGGFTIFSIKHLSVELNIPENLFGKTAVQSHFELQSFTSIGSFPTAKHEPNNDEISERLDKIKTDINERIQRDTLSFLIIIGDADKRLLGSKSEAIYGENRGLAQARANWVKSYLLQKPSLQLDSSRIIVLISGPDNIGSIVPPTNLEEDRSVKIYIGWTIIRKE